MANVSFDAEAQFVTFPDLAPSPVWVPPAVYTDGFCAIPGSQWVAVPSGDATVDPGYTGDAYAGTASLKIAGLRASAGVSCNCQSSFYVSDGQFLTFAIKAGTAAAVNNLAITFGGYDGAGAPAMSTGVVLPTISDTWRILRIPLQPARTPVRINQILIESTSSEAAAPVLLDSIEFSQP